MSRSKKSKRKNKGMAPTTVRFNPNVLAILEQHAKATGLSASHVANIMILTGHQATAGNVSAVNATRKLLAAYVATKKIDETAAAKRAAASKGIRDAKAVLAGGKGTEQKPAEQKPNAA